VRRQLRVGRAGADDGRPVGPQRRGDPRAAGGVEHRQRRVGPPDPGQSRPPAAARLQLQHLGEFGPERVGQPGGGVRAQLGDVVPGQRRPGGHRQGRLLPPAGVQLGVAHHPLGHVLDQVTVPHTSPPASVSGRTRADCCIRPSGARRRPGRGWG
jgi:hypothetical protein